MSDTAISRRALVTSAACAGIAGAIAGAAPVARASESASFTFADTVAWNAEYDVVVIGFGGAGGTAAINAADAGARVLICDVAPEGHEGGNTRYACQMLVSGSDPEAMYDYYRNGLFWHFNADEEALRTYTDELCKMDEHLVALGADKDSLFVWPNGTIVTPEYPEYSGGETVTEHFVRQGGYDAALWKLIRAGVYDRTGKIDVWYESPAVHLVQDPQSKTVVGVEIDKQGTTALVHALNGVVLACGGFENNQEMIQDYLGAARFLPIGTLYNKGDGVRMGIEVGADLWHMEAYESLGIMCGNAWADDESKRAVLEPSHKAKKSVPLISLNSEDFAQGSVMLVGDDGSRFVDETMTHRHGHVYDCGAWRMPTANWAPHLVFDQAQLDYFREEGRIDDEREAKLVSASTPEELADKIGADPDRLAQTIADFNFFAQNGRDYKLDRPADSMRALTGDTYYAAEFRAAILNTQGGPRRNKNAEVLDTAGEPIPHLYSAGELGGICAFQYNSGGNLAECVIFGQIAGKNAAAQKDPLPAVKALEPVQPALAYEAGSASDETIAEAAVSLGDNERVGMSDAGMGGTLKLKVTLDGTTITAVDVLACTETPEYGGKAIDKLVEEAVAAGSPNIDVVAGATMTSAAFIAALSDALEG